MIKPFRARYPGLRLSLVSSENFINLIDRKVDIAIRAGKLDNSSLRARHLFTSYRRLVASPAYIAERGMPRSVADLSLHECLGFLEFPRLNRWPLKSVKNQSLTIRQNLLANSGETLKQLCLNGCGVACLSEFSVAREIAEGRLIQLLVNQTIAEAMPFNAVYYSDLIVSHRIRVFIDFLTEYIENQPW